MFGTWMAIDSLLGYWLCFAYRLWCQLYFHGTLGCYRKPMSEIQTPETAAEPMPENKLAASPVSTRLFWVGAGAITLFGTILRLINLVSRSLWVDETTAIQSSMHALDSVIVRAPPFGQLYQIAIAATNRLVGPGELGVRLPAFIAGAIAIPLALAAARRTGASRGTALLFGLLIAVQEHAVYFSQEGRSYSFLLCCALIGVIGAADFQQGRKRGYWLLAAAGFCGVLNHLGFGLTVIALGFVLLGRKNFAGQPIAFSKRFKAIAVLGAGTITATALGILFLYLFDPASFGNLSIQSRGATSLAQDFWPDLRLLTGAYRPFDIAALVAALLGVGFAIVRRENRPWLWLAVFAGVGPIVLFTARGDMWPLRYSLPGLPGLLFLMAAGITQTSSRLFRAKGHARWATLLIVALGIAVFAGQAKATKTDKDFGLPRGMALDWRAVGEAICEGAGNGDYVSLQVTGRFGFVPLSAFSYYSCIQWYVETSCGKKMSFLELADYSGYIPPLPKNPLRPSWPVLTPDDSSAKAHRLHWIFITVYQPQWLDRTNWIPPEQLPGFDQWQQTFAERLLSGRWPLSTKVTPVPGAVVISAADPGPETRSRFGRQLHNIIYPTYFGMLDRR
jgi:hypothetical protein